MTTNKPNSCSSGCSNITETKEKLNVLVVGETGVGKSSLIKAITGNSNILTSDSVKGCTFSISSSNYDNITFYDTCGLGETKEGAISTADAFEKCLQFLVRMKDVGLNLIMFVHRGKITKNFIDIWKLFYQVIGNEEIPAICVFTGCESSSNLYEWKKENEENIKAYNFKFSSISGTCFASSQNPILEAAYSELRSASKHVVLLAVYTHASKTPIIVMKPETIEKQLKATWNKLVEYGQKPEWKWVDKSIMENLKSIECSVSQKKRIGEIIELVLHSFSFKPCDLPKIVEAKSY